MRTYNPSLGTHISGAINAALALARRHNDDVTFTFNGASVTVAADVALGRAPRVDYLKVWNDAMEANAAAYRASPEGIRAQQEADERLAECKHQNASLAISLPTVLTSGDNATILGWFCELETYSHIGAPVDYPALAEQFVAAGYAANVNLGPDLKPDDADNVARYIIGQCVHMMSGGMPPHGLVHRSTERWVETFGAAAN